MKKKKVLELITNYRAQAQEAIEYNSWGEFDYWYKKTQRTALQYIADGGEGAQEVAQEALKPYI